MRSSLLLLAMLLAPAFASAQAAEPVKVESPPPADPKPAEPKVEPQNEPKIEPQGEPKPRPPEPPKGTPPPKPSSKVAAKVAGLDFSLAGTAHPGPRPRPR